VAKLAETTWSDFGLLDWRDIGRLGMGKKDYLSDNMMNKTPQGTSSANLSFNQKVRAC